MDSDPFDSSPALASYRDAAAKLFADIAGPDRQRALEHGDAGAQREAWRAFGAFGLDEMLAEASPDDQAAVAAAVGFEAGRALYCGPIVEGCVSAFVDGVSGAGTGSSAGASANAGANTSEGTYALLAIDPIVELADPVRSPSGRSLRFPYGDLADRIIGSTSMDEPPGFSPGEPAEAAITHHRQIDGSSLSVVELVPAPSRVAPDSEDAARFRLAAELLLLSTSARLIGIAAHVQALVQEYASMRTQFGKTLASFQALQHRIVDGHIEITLARELLVGITSDWSGHAYRPALLFALKSQASRTAMLVARNGVQLYGGMGFSDEGPVGVYLRHAMVLAARYGSEAAARDRYREAGVDLLA